MSDYQVHVIHVDGTTTEHVVTDSGSASEIDQLQKLVGGYIELLPQRPIYAGQRRGCYVNKEGVLLRLQHSVLASEIANYPILGNLIIVMGEVK